MGPLRRLPFVAFLVAAALAVRLWGIDDSWSTRIWSGEFGAFATGAPARNFLEHGFLDSYGVPMEWRIETASGAVARHYYLHHPATYMWFAGLFLELFGPVEWGLRLLAVLGSTLACLAGYLFARRAAGERAARIAALVWAFAPYGLRDGLQLWTEVPIAGTAAMMLLSYLRWIDSRATRDLVWCCVWYGAGCLLDWPAHFYGPVIALHAGFVAATRRDVRWLVAPVALFAVSVVAVALVWLHLGSVVGFERLEQERKATSEGVFRLAREYLFWRNQFVGWVHGLTLLAAALAILGLCAAVLRRRPLHESLLVLFAVLPGLAYVALFPGRSENHLFFFAVSLPAFAVLAGIGADTIGRAVASMPSRTVARFDGPVTALLGVAIVAGGLASHAELRRVSADDLMRLVVNEPVMQDVLSDPRALVLTPPGYGFYLAFYSRAPIYGRLFGAAEVDGIVRDELSRLEPERRAFVFLDLDVADNPALPPEHRPHYRMLIDEFEAKLAEYGEPKRFDITDNLGLAHRFALFELPTGVTDPVGP